MGNRKSDIARSIITAINPEKILKALKEREIKEEKRGLLIILSNIVNRINSAKKRIEYYGTVRLR